MTEAVKHTPGPWIVHGGLLGHKGDVFVPTEKSIKDCHHVARCFAPKPIKNPIDDLQVLVAERDAIRIIEANARLIAAAPDLFEAVKKAETLITRTLCNWLNAEWAAVPGPGTDVGDTIALIEAAIAKAEGRS